MFFGGFEKSRFGEKGWSRGGLVLGSLLPDLGLPSSWCWSWCRASSLSCSSRVPPVCSRFAAPPHMGHAGLRSSRHALLRHCSSQHLHFHTHPNPCLLIAVWNVPCPENFMMFPWRRIWSGTWYTRQCIYGVTFFFWYPSR